MDFIPVISKSKKIKSSSKISKLSLKSRRQCSQAHCYSQPVDAESSVGSNFSMSQPLPDIDSQEDEEVRVQPSKLSAIEEELLDENEVPTPVEKERPNVIQTEEESQCDDQALLVEEEHQKKDQKIVEKCTSSPDLFPDVDSPDLPGNCKNNREEIIDLTSNTEDELSQENECSENVSPKPCLDKIRHLSTNEDMECAKVNSSNSSSWMSKDTEINQKHQNSKPTNENPENSDTLSSNNKYDKSKLSTKLQAFSKQEPKKFCIKRSDAVSDDAGPKNDTSDNRGDAEDDFKLHAEVKNKDTTPAIEETDNIVAAQKVPEPSTEATSTEADRGKNVTDELPCPICNKYAGKKRRAHMKACAAKNNFTTAQLLKAMELQEKQAEERKALGLPVTNLQPMQRLLVKKKSGTVGVGKDANIQLAMAMSMSLLEAQEHEELLQMREILGDEETFEWHATPSQVEQAAKTMATAGPSTSQLVLQPNASGMLQLTNKPPPGRRAGKSVEVPSNRFHSKEERERRITEKVALLLLDEEKQESVPVAGRKSPTNLSANLGKLQSKCPALWELAAETHSDKLQKFYVQGLSEFISPSTRDPGAALRHLSQIPGRCKTPEKEITSKNLPLCGFIEAKASSSTRAEPSTSHTMTSSEKYKSPSTMVSRPSRRDGEGLRRDWAKLLNSKDMSDISVYVRGDLELRAHKLVIFARCPAMLEDMAKDLSPRTDRVREQMFLWSDVSYNAALAMLEFLYCDTTERATTLHQEDLQQLTELAKRYKVKELVQHIKMLANIRNSLGVCRQETSGFSCSKGQSSPSPVKLSPKLFQAKTPERSQTKNKAYNSPDVRLTPKSADKTVQSSTERCDIDYLVSMMDKTQTQNINKSTLAKDSSPKINESKRKYSSSPTILGSSQKKICRNLTADLDIAENTPEKVGVMSTSQLFDLLENSPLRKSNGDFETLRNDKVLENSRLLNTTAALPADTDIWDNFDDCGYDPVAYSPSQGVEKSNSQESFTIEHIPSPALISPVASQQSENESPVHSNKSQNLDEVLSPEVITVSSDTASQHLSQVSNSSVAASVASNPKDDTSDSMDAFVDVDYSRLEQEAINTYQKKVSSKSPEIMRQSTPINQVRNTTEDEITPLADYSMMDSPTLQQHLYNYGIRRLSRNKAKRILRHIYDELHPWVPITPVAGCSKNDQQSTVNREEDSTVSESRKEGGVKKTKNNRKIHDISLTQPAPSRSRKEGVAKKTESNKKVHDISFSQPAPSKGRKEGVTKKTESKKIHDISFSQPAPSQFDDSFEEMIFGKLGPSVHNAHNISLSQPPALPVNNANESSSDSDDSSSSSDDSEIREYLKYAEAEICVGKAGKSLETPAEVSEVMRKLIISEPQLHHQLLMYEPVMLSELQAMVKRNNTRCNVKYLLDYLDEHCITFRTPRPPRAPCYGRSQKKRSPRKAGTASQRGTRGRGRRPAAIDI